MLLATIDQYLAPPVLFMLGVAMFTWVVLRFRKQARAQARPQASTRPTPGLRPTEVRAMAEELNALLVELQETARRISAQIDNRYQKLDALIAEADAKIRRLEELQAQLAAQDVRGPASPRREGFHEVLPPLPDDPKHRPVYELADQGKSAREIAQQLGTQPGEVELILALRPRVTAR